MIACKSMKSEQMHNFLLTAKAAEANAKWQSESQIPMRDLAHHISVPKCFQGTFAEEWYHGEKRGEDRRAM